MSLSPLPSSPPSSFVQTPLPSSKSPPVTYSRSRRQIKKPIAYGSVVNSDSVEEYISDEPAEDVEEVEGDDESDGYGLGGNKDDEEDEDGQEEEDPEEDEESEEEVPKAKKARKSATKKESSKSDKVDKPSKGGKGKQGKDVPKTKGKQATIAAQVFKSATTKTSKSGPKPTPIAVKPINIGKSKVVKSKKIVTSDDEAAESDKAAEEKEDVHDDETLDAEPVNEDAGSEEEPSSQRPFSWAGKASQTQITSPVRPQSTIALSSPPTAPKKALGVGAKTVGLGDKGKVATSGSTKAKAGLSSKTPRGFKAPGPASKPGAGKVQLKRVDVTKTNEKTEIKVKETKKVVAKKIPVKKAESVEDDEEEEDKVEDEGGERSPYPSMDEKEDADEKIEPVEKKQKQAPAGKDTGKAKAIPKAKQIKVKAAQKAGSDLQKQPSSSPAASTDSTGSSKRPRLVLEVEIATKKRSLTNESGHSSPKQSSPEAKKSKSAPKAKPKGAKAQKQDETELGVSDEEDSPTTKSKSKAADKAGSGSQPNSLPSDYESAETMDLDEFPESQLPSTQAPKQWSGTDDSSSEEAPVTESQESETSKKSTPSKKRKHEEDSSQDSVPKKKPAPAEKITSEHRVCIMAALADSKFVKDLKFDSVGTPGSKFGRHWREVLAKDLTKHYKGEDVSKSGGGSVSKAERLGIWKIICESMDKADWPTVSKETGMAVGKLKRHLREVMKKDAEKFIGK